MNYYGWAGKEKGQLRFLIQEIEIVRDSPYKQGDWIVDGNKVLYTNIPFKTPEFESDSVEVEGSHVFDKLEDTMQHVVMEVFNVQR